MGLCFLIPDPVSFQIFFVQVNL